MLNQPDFRGLLPANTVDLAPLLEAVRRQNTKQVALLREILRRLAANLAPATDSTRRMLDAAQQLLEDPFLRDVTLLYLGKGTEAEREAALQRLAAYFTRGRVFHPRRWRLLEPAFTAYCREAEQSPAEAWDSLVMAALLMASASLPDDVPLGELYDYLRREVRAEIERALLDGQTLAEYMYRPEAAWPESEETHAIENLGAAAGLTLEQVTMLKQLQPLLERLTERELEALSDGANDTAARVARSRARRKVLAALAPAM